MSSAGAKGGRKTGGGFVEFRGATPAKAQRLTDHVWTIGELLTACLDNAPAKPCKAHRRFRVIEGGRKD
jgi:hypothetical protein